MQAPALPRRKLLGLLMPILHAMMHEPTFINAKLPTATRTTPTRFMLYETWADLDEVKQVQIHRAYRQAYLARLPELLREDRQIQIWQPMRATSPSSPQTKARRVRKPIRDDLSRPRRETQNA